MKEYRNAIRSKKMIRESFATLLNKKGSVEKVTIKEIVELADISKSTFYAHYDNIDDLIQDFENEFIDALEYEIDRFNEKPSKNFFPYIDGIMSLLKKNENTYKLLISPSLPSLFIHKLKKVVYRRVVSDSRFDKLSVNVNIRQAKIDYAVSGVIGVIEDYFNGTNKISLDETGQIINEILMKLVQ